MKILESYKKIAKSMLTEHAWDRKFGEPLPTLEDVMREAEEVDPDKVIGKNDDDKDITVKQAMDYSGDNETMNTLKKKAQDLKSNGGEEEPKSKGLEPDDFERDFDDDSKTGGEPEGGEEPEGTDNSAALKKIKRKDLNKLSGGDAWEKDFYSDDDIFLGSPDYEQEEGDAYWESPDLDGLSRATDHTTLKQKFFDLHAYRSTLQSRIEMADDEGDTEEVAKLQKDWMKAAKQQNNIVGMMKPQFKGMSGRSSYGGVGIRDSVTINGKKYKEVKEEKKVTEKHILREMYEKIGGK